jgi:glycogen synthase
LIDKLRPDILHNFDNPFLLSKLKNKPKCAVYTFDDLEYLRDKTPSLKDYNFITTFSKGYSKAIFSLNNQVIEALRETNFREVTIGITTEIFNPEKGLLISHPYSKDNLFGKQLCKKRLAEKLNIDE